MWIWCLETYFENDLRYLATVTTVNYCNQLNSAGLLSLKTHRQKYQLIVISKLYKGFFNPTFRRFFEVLSSHNSRGRDNLISANVLSHIYRFSFFSISSFMLWNQLHKLKCFWYFFFFFLLLFCIACFAVDLCSLSFLPLCLPSETAKC